MNISNELERLLEEVADICDSGEYQKLKDGASTRYDGNGYGEGLLIAYQNFIATEEGGKWYDEAVQENHQMLFRDGE